MAELIGKGWIRVRYEPRNFILKYQIIGFNDRNIGTIIEFSSFLLHKKLIDEHASISVLDLQLRDWTIENGIESVRKLMITVIDG
jgi:hypothetical protein